MNEALEYIQPPQLHKASNIPYLISIVIMTMLGVASVIIIFILRPNQDNAPLYGAIASFVGPTTVALLAFLKTQETHLLVNSRMDEFKRQVADNATIATELARVRGIVEGLKSQPIRP